MTAGVSWDELLEPQARPPEADPDPDDLDERGDLGEMQRYCQKFAGLPGAPATGASVLTEWETRFIWSLAVSQRVLTQKQISILPKIHTKCQLAAARAAASGQYSGNRRF
jgi:hypothetical protein